MRRVLALLLILALSLPLLACAESSIVFDIDDLSEEESLALLQHLLIRHVCENAGDIVYDEDGVTISWIGIVEKDKFGFIIENRTGMDVYFELNNVAVNGIQFSVHWNTGKKEILDGMSLYTGSYSKWMIDDDAFESLGITHASLIYLDIGLYDSTDYGAKPIRTIQLRFPVDEDIQ